MVAAYSNSGPALTFFAPANRVATTDLVGSGGYAPGNYTTTFGGTSAACPYAAGAAAVLQSAAFARTGSFLTPSEVKAALVASGDSITDGKTPLTRPRVNLGRAIAALPGTVLSVASTNPAQGVAIGVSPSDRDGGSDGATPFVRTYDRGAVVTLTAPPTAAGNPFGGWFGCTSAAGAVCSVSVEAAATARAYYRDLAAAPRPNDFDGDGRSDIGCYHPPDGAWFGFNSAAGFWQTQFGYEGTLPVTGNFDADGRTDIGCYFPAGGAWYFFRSAAGFAQTHLGFAGTVPVVGDFDGDGRDDIGAYHADSGGWYLSQSSSGFWQTQFGYAGTLPVVGDFDGDGRSDIGVYHPESGAWHLFKSTDGSWQTQFGYAGTLPVVGDFDGDGRSDIGVYHPESGAWHLFRSAEGYWQTRFGFPGTIPFGVPTR
jgi:hypothetical protein